VIPSDDLGHLGFGMEIASKRDQSHYNIFMGKQLIELS
jgi:hypothetical protein